MIPHVSECFVVLMMQISDMYVPVQGGMQMIIWIGYAYLVTVTLSCDVNA